VVHRQRGADRILVDAAVAAARVEPLSDLRASLAGHLFVPSPGGDQITSHEALVVLRQGCALGS
jgi:hypothetical protein